MVAEEIVIPAQEGILPNGIVAIDETAYAETPRTRVALLDDTPVETRGRIIQRTFQDV
jgi:hypothetical protein